VGGPASFCQLAKAVARLGGFFLSRFSVVRDCNLFIYFYLFSSSTSNGIEVQAKNILAEWPTLG